MSFSLHQNNVASLLNMSLVMAGDGGRESQVSHYHRESGADVAAIEKLSYLLSAMTCPQHLPVFT